MTDRNDEVGMDVTAVLPVEPELELTEMVEVDTDQLFYSCLRGYGWKG